MATTDAEPAAPPRADVRVLIWDLPTRITHWLIVASFAVSWWSARNDMMDWHYRSGIAMLALVVFRLLWGFVGSGPSRFASFVRGPRAVARYARTLGSRSHHVMPGHNPLGGWSVMALLAALVAQVVLGLFAVDTDGIESGPLSWLVEFETGRAAAEWHAAIYALLLILIGIHIVAILFYLVYKRENLVSAMVGGYKRMAAAPLPALRRSGKVAFFVALLVALGVTWAVWSGLPFLG